MRPPGNLHLGQKRLLVSGEIQSRPNEPIAIRVRPFVLADRAFVLGLAPRLVIGIPPWRDPGKMLETATGWLEHSIAQHGDETMLFVAEDGDGSPLGFASVSHSTHFTGVSQAEIGELAVAEAREGHGVGRALVAACAGWARGRGYRFLTLGTGAANERARRFYRRLGFLEEDVRLAKPL